MPPATAALIAANVGMFFIASAIPQLMLRFALWPIGGEWMILSRAGAGFAPWQLVTYAFLHGGFMHLAVNMFGLYMFGAPLEQVFGARRYLVYYFSCVLTAALTQLAVLALSGTFVPTVGASGGVFGLLLGFAMLFPHTRIVLLIPPIPMRARTLVIVYGAIELLMGFSGLQPGVAHFAHLGGMFFGWMLIRYWRGQPPFGRRGPPRPRIVR
jgi:membrane associated rhomboid family serine protease